ncbi:cytochrome-c peroxidase [Acanthopleuribacter pedis]|uniref:Methylamine utilization protein MauG n=1 Tax=Acanthopleuribacter pedis TaxID=442870 RepID=A0A8J7U4B5_9BACT|nr:cytochrome c peroxidase [Acanthopleuribacter pedis]MBO1319634.1 c-type cytochrome [Acanthopleuribacter pedis]
MGLLLITPLAAQPPIGTPDEFDIEYPDDEEPSAEQVALGKTLFFDTRLSGKQNMSCASCHNPDLGFGDGLEKGVGSDGTILGRNTPHLYNLAWNALFFWDGRAASLEEQALGPIESDVEMNLQLPELIKRLKAVPFYQKHFAEAYPDQKPAISETTIGHAIASFERTLISDNAPFDRFMKGETEAMSEEARRGMALFLGKARCINCHNGPNFTDNGFHNIGVASGDVGRAAVQKGVTTQGAFKTPGLRNVLLTGPYMHDGSIGSLGAVVQHYIDAPKKGGKLSPQMEKIELSDLEILDLVAFMGALTDPVPVTPAKVP